MKLWNHVTLASVLAVTLTACQQASETTPPEPILVLANAEACSIPQMLGQFNAPQDLLITNFDSKPDADDLHSIAAMATVIRDPRLACVRHVAVAGAYGRQGGAYINAPELFDLAFGDNWVDAHHSREAAIDALAASITETTDAGGHVWITEAGQSDISAAAVREAMELSTDLDPQTQIHIVQHSDWNEDQTTPEDLSFVKSMTHYHKIPDGNELDNGSPGYKTETFTDWSAVLADPVNGATWAEAKRVADAANPVSTYLNPAIDSGGFDFSDTAELTWIFGFNDLADHEAFFETFLQTPED